MKKAEEYWDDLESDTYDYIVAIFKQVQIDTIKETCKVCADSADADFNFNCDADSHVSYNDVEVYVIKSSILEVADKLIKEL